MIDMQVRAEHHIDLLGRDAGRAQLREPGPVAPVEGRTPARLVVAAAAVDQDGEAILANQEALDGEREIAARRILKTRTEPVAIGGEVLGRAVRQQLERRHRQRFNLDDTAERCPPEGPERR